MILASALIICVAGQYNQGVKERTFQGLNNNINFILLLWLLFLFRLCYCFFAGDDDDKYMLLFSFFDIQV